MEIQIFLVRTKEVYLPAVQHRVESSPHFLRRTCRYKMARSMLIKHWRTPQSTNQTKTFCQMVKKPDSLRSNDKPATARNSSSNRVHRHRLELWKALLDLQNWRWVSWIAFELKFFTFASLFLCMFLWTSFLMTKTLFWRCVTSEKNIVYLPRYQLLGERTRH